MNAKIDDSLHRAGGAIEWSTEIEQLANQNENAIQSNAPYAEIVELTLGNLAKITEGINQMRDLLPGADNLIECAREDKQRARDAAHAAEDAARKRTV